jgi:hypothetical protein
MSRLTVGCVQGSIWIQLFQASCGIKMYLASSEKEISQGRMSWGRPAPRPRSPRNRRPRPQPSVHRQVRNRTAASQEQNSLARVSQAKRQSAGARRAEAMERPNENKMSCCNRERAASARVELIETWIVLQFAPAVGQMFASMHQIELGPGFDSRPLPLPLPSVLRASHQR